MPDNHVAVRTLALVEPRGVRRRASGRRRADGVAFGAVVTLAAPAGMGTMDGVQDTTGRFGSVMLVLFLLSVISHNALNLYGAVLAIITSVQTLRAPWIPTARARVILSTVILVAASVVATALTADFVSHFVDLVVVLLVVLVP